MTAPRPWDLRLGRWQDVLADVEMVDAVITDPPYSARTHEGYRTATDFGVDVPVPSNGDRKKRQPGGSRGCATRMPKSRYELPYAPLTEETVRLAVATFHPSQWWVVFGDHESAQWWRAALDDAGMLVFAPVPWVRIGSAPRFYADGPACSAEWITIARPRKLPRVRRSRPGHYIGTPYTEKVVTGGKPAWLMTALVRDYTEAGELVLDPFAGGATTLLAASIEGRRSVGAECDPETYAKARKRLEAGYTPTFDFGEEMAR